MHLSQQLGYNLYLPGLGLFVKGLAGMAIELNASVGVSEHRDV